MSTTGTGPLLQKPAILRLALGLGHPKSSSDPIASLIKCKAEGLVRSNRGFEGETGLKIPPYGTAKAPSDQQSAIMANREAGCHFVGKSAQAHRLIGANHPKHQESIFAGGDK